MRFGERVRETTTTTGTGSYALAGAVAGHVTFLTGIGANSLVGYVATDGTDWEVGYGTLSSGPATLTRAAILASSNAGAAVNWTAGTRQIYSAPIASVMQGLVVGFIGTARPAWARAGLVWIDSSATPWVRKLYDGTDDIALERIDATNNRAVFEGVKATDIASASSIDLGAATGSFLHVTGTTAISALGTVAAGVQRLVRFAGALLLTYNATSLILPGAASITTAANDVALFVSEGSGNWRCAFYVRADGTAVVREARPTRKVVKSSGAFTVTVPTGARAADIIMTGAGGGGGGSDNNLGIGAGGGAGGTLRFIVDIVALGLTQLTGSVGAGGTAGSNTGGNGGDGGATTLTGFYSAPGGGGGGGVSSSDSDPGGTGGVPAVGSPNDEITEIAGGDGGPGVFYTNSGNVQVTGGWGGASFWGGGPTGWSQTNDGSAQVSSAGGAGTAPGSGGAGGASNSTTGQVGGVGANGIVEITWRY